MNVDQEVLEHAARARIAKTKLKVLGPKTRDDYIRRLNLFKAWIAEHHSEHEPRQVLPGASRVTSSKGKESPGHINYAHLDHKLFEVYLGLAQVVTKVKNVRVRVGDGTFRVDRVTVQTHASDSTVRKPYDAIMHFARELELHAPAEFVTQTLSILKCNKKEIDSARQDGQYDDTSADPLPTRLYMWLLMHAYTAFSLFFGAWTCWQWNCIARGINMQTLHYKCLSVRNDSLHVEFPKTKTSKGEKVVYPKHVFANPLRVELCPVTWLGIYVCCNPEVNATGQVFLGGDAASVKYATTLKSILQEHQDMVEGMGGNVERLSRKHCIRKGAGTAAAASSTAAPSIVSIVRRGDWSLGKVLDLYLRWADGGDQYCGRIMTLLNPDTAEFATLPPFFKEGTGIELIHKVLEEVFGTGENSVLTRFPTMRPVLIMCLASMVHHADTIKEMLDKNVRLWGPTFGSRVPGSEDYVGVHPLMQQVKLFRSASLLGLRGTTSLDPKDRQAPRATGVPPFVMNIKKLEDILVVAKKNAETLANLGTTLTTSFGAFLEARARSDGIVTTASMNTQFQKLEMQMTKMTESIQTLSLAGAQRQPTEPVAPHFNAMLGMAGGRLTVLPPGYKFPSPTLRVGWEMWLTGDEVNKIPALRNVSRGNVSGSSNKDIFKRWTSIFRFMERGLASVVPSNAVDSRFVESSYKQAMVFLKSRLQYMFKKPACLQLKVGTWAKSIKNSEIWSNGTEADKAHLPPDARERCALAVQALAEKHARDMQTYEQMRDDGCAFSPDGAMTAGAWKRCERESLRRRLNPEVAVSTTTEVAVSTLAGGSAAPALE